MRILVIEDEIKVANFIKHGLEQERYIIDLATDGNYGLGLALNNKFDAILLDVMLPGKNGIEILKELRAANIATPVLMLTALGSTEDKVAGLDLGADDYLAKPFSFEELTARLRAILRRSTTVKTTKIQFADLILDTVSHLAIKNDKEIELTTKEYALLEYLMRNTHKVLSRSNITQHVWKHDFDPDSNIIDVYIKRLRIKLGDSKDKPLIKSTRGVGYRMVEE